MEKKEEGEETILERLQGERESAAKREQYIEAAIELISQFPADWELSFGEIPSGVLVAVTEMIQDRAEELTQNIEGDTLVGEYLHRLPVFSSLISFGIAWGRFHPSPVERQKIAKENLGIKEVKEQNESVEMGASDSRAGKDCRRSQEVSGSKSKGSIVTSRRHRLKGD